MQVELRELFELGVRRPKADVRRGVAVRGELHIDRMWTHRDVDSAPVHAHLKPYVVESLYRAKLIYLSGRNLVLEGKQRGPVPGKRSAETEYQQIWWCRLVKEDPAASHLPESTSAPSPSAFQRQVEHEA